MPLQYVLAASALFLSSVFIGAALRQRTPRKFQKNALLLAFGFLVAAVILNSWINLVLVQQTAGDLAATSSAVLLAKRLQAGFDFVFAIVIGVFIVATTNPKISSAKEFRTWVAEHFPNTFTAYTAIMIAGFLAVLVTPASVEFPGWPVTVPARITFPLLFYIIVGTAVFAQLAWTPYMLLKHVKKACPSPTMVRNIWLIIVGIDLYGVSELMFEVVLPAASIDLRALGFVIEMFLIGMVAFAVRQRQFLHDLLVPRAEADLKTERAFDLRPGTGYVVVEESPKHSLEIFRDMVTHGAQGLCITRQPPKAIMEEYGLEKTPILWLSRVATQKNCLRPTPPENIAMAVEHFVKVSQNAVVLLDGVEYIVAHNDFSSVLALLHDLNEDVALNNAVMLVTLDPNAFQPREFALIRRDLKVIVPPGREILPPKIELRYLDKGHA